VQTLELQTFCLCLSKQDLEVGMAEHFRRFLVSCFSAAVVACALFSTSSAQSAQAQPAQGENAPQSDPDRKQALEFMDGGKMAQAMPLFEKLCSEYPKDAAMWEGWGQTTLAYSQTLSDPDQRKKARARARSFLVKAKELGDNSNLLQILLGMIPEDGGDNSFSPSKEVNDVMQKAEADFSRGDLDKAREGYLHALLLEPKNYHAALFIGDVYFKQRIHGSAAEWFARAIEIDPNQETAYRYWGDALSAMGKENEAREKYIQAVVADPYNNRCWIGLTQWADRTKVKLNWIRLQDKSAVTVKDDQNINITVDSGSMKKHDPTGSAWMMYGMNRALWHGEKFKKEFPDEPKYRRTMREETESLHMMVDVLIGQKDFEKRKKDLDPALVDLVSIDKAGFLEPFALLNRADNEIAQDYAAYRETHRDTIYRYMNEYVVPKGPQQETNP